MSVNKSKNNKKKKSQATKRMPTSSNFQETRRIDTGKLSQATKVVSSKQKKSNGKNGNMIENHQYYISSLVECTNIGVSVQKVPQVEIES